MTTYTELHCHSNYSFKEGASSIDELLARATELGYHALALTDHDNLCGAMEFARLAASLGIKPITGAEVTLKGGSHLTLLAETRKGYSNLCRLISYAHVTTDRRNPELDPYFLASHAEGIVLLTGCRKGPIPCLLSHGRYEEAEALLQKHMEWFGPDNVFVELQQNLVQGDTGRNRRLVELARDLDVGIVATNNVHYHVPERHRLQDALVSIQHNKTLDETHRQRRPNAHFHLKSPADMAALFDEVPEAIENTLRIAERCSFDLTRNLDYRFPDYPVPEGFTPQTYLERLCHEAAARRYGSVTPRVRERLDEELRLIRRHDLAGFFLIYHEIIQLAREIMIELGLSNPEIPLEERSPGRGRGSSVAMLVGYLIGLSHIDPLEFNLSLDRFLNDEMGAVPDIDLDFPRDIREELIKRVHHRWGWDHAALTGMISTYRMKGALRDLGKVLSLPQEQVDKLAKRVEGYSARGLKSEMLGLPEFQDRVDAPVWRDLIDLAAQLDGFPKYLAQHPGGMVIGSSPLIDIVPVQQGAIDDRYICHWDKNSVVDAGFVKIDFLALGALSQMYDILQLVEERTGHYIDLSRIDFEDGAVYDMLHKADTIGIFQVESAAQMQTITRIKPRNLTEMAYEVGAVRPGVGVNDGVSQFIHRHAYGAQWDFDDPLEKRALERTLGVILFQDQVNQVAIDVGGLSPAEADQLRRVFTRRNNERLIQLYWDRFREGAMGRGVSEEVAAKIFKKFNGYYMFPESHAFAFGVTAYHMAWLKYYYPLEFFVAIFNQQPMGFYNLETLKEDAKRHGVTILNPDINASVEKCVIKSISPEDGDSCATRQGVTPAKDSGEGSSYSRRSPGRACPELVEGAGQESRSGRGEYTSPSPLARERGTQGVRDPHAEAILLGLLNVKGVGQAATTPIVEERERSGPYKDLGDAMRRMGLHREATENMVAAGAFDALAPDRRAALWEVGLRYRPPNGGQQALHLPVAQDMAELPELTPWEVMAGEYHTLGLYPEGHLMAFLRPHLDPGVTPSHEALDLEDGAQVTVAGVVIRRQRPLAKAVFITLEDEFGHVPLVLWPRVYERYRLACREPVLVVKGIVSRREGTMNIAVRHVEGVRAIRDVPKAKSWQ